MSKYPNSISNIELEPRLKSYLKKRTYYKKNNISCSNLDKEYWITDEDKKTMSGYLKQKKNIVSGLEQDIDSKRCPNSVFPSTALGLFEDSRIPKIKNKVALEPVINRGMFAGGNMYEEKPDKKVDILMDVRDVNDKANKMKGSNLNNSRFDPRIDPVMISGKPDFNKYESQYRVIDGDKFNDRYGRDYDAVQGDKSEMDTVNKVVIPNMGFKNGKSLNTSSYIMTNFNNDSDRNKSNDMRLVDGMPSRTKKSYGFRDTSHFQFDFIDQNYQNANNSVEPWARGGEGTRMFNKSKSCDN